MSRKRPKHVIRASRRNRVNSVTDPRAIVRPDNAATVQPSKPHLGFPEPKFRPEPPKELKPMTTPTGAPSPTQIPPSVPRATKVDVDAVLDLIHTLTKRVEATAADARIHDLATNSRINDTNARLSLLEQRPAALNPAPKVDALQQVRNDIEAWLKTLPLGMWVSTGVVARNLGAESEKDVSLYRRQVERMAKLGTLDKEGGSAVGSTAQFKLKRELHPEFDEYEAKWDD